MREPLRLRHDPDAPVDLRSALEAEARRPLPHDLGALKAGLTKAMAAGTPATTRSWSPALITGAVALALIGAYTLWGRTPDVAPARPAPAITVAEAPAPTRVEETAPREDAEAVAAPGETEAPEGTVAMAVTAPEPVRSVRPRVPRAAPTPIPTSAPEPSGLAAELASYQQAQATLRSGQHDEAAEAFARHRARFPEGRLDREAALGQLEALHRSSQANAAVSQAQALLRAPDLGGRRAEVLRVLAEAQVLRGQCEEARAAFAQAREAGATITADAEQGALQACERSRHR